MFRVKSVSVVCVIRISLVRLCNALSLRISYKLETNELELRNRINSGN